MIPTQLLLVLLFALIALAADSGRPAPNDSNPDRTLGNRNQPAPRAPGLMRPRSLYWQLRSQEQYQYRGLTRNGKEMPSSDEHLESRE